MRANTRKVAGVAELVDAPDLGSGDENRGGSSPFARTNTSFLVSNRVPAPMKQADQARWIVTCR